MKAMERESLCLTLEQTDISDFPASPPITAYLSVVGQTLHVRAERSGTIAADITFEFDLPKACINSAIVKLVADVPDDFEYTPWNQPELSTATIFHKDPFEVVPEFKTTFSSPKSYWIKAFRKMLRDKLNVDARDEAEISSLNKS